MVRPGGAVLDRSHSLGGNPGPLGHLRLTQTEFSPAPSQEAAGAVQFTQNIDQGLVAADIELGLLVQPGLALHERGGRAGAGCGAASHHAHTV